MDEFIKLRKILQEQSISFSSSISILRTRSRIAILQDDLIDNLSADDTPPPHKVLMRSVESFADHHTSATTTLHKTLLEIDFTFLQNLQFVIPNERFVNPSKESIFFKPFSSQ